MVRNVSRDDLSNIRIRWDGRQIADYQGMTVVWSYAVNMYWSVDLQTWINPV